MTTDPNPLIRPGQCGHTVVIGRFKWVCIREPHASGKSRVRFSDRVVLTDGDQHRLVNAYADAAEHV